MAMDMAGIFHPILIARNTNYGLVVSQGVLVSLVHASLASTEKSGAEDKFKGQLRHT